MLNNMLGYGKNFFFFYVYCASGIIYIYIYIYYIYIYNLVLHTFKLSNEIAQFMVNIFHTHLLGGE